MSRVQKESLRRYWDFLLKRKDQLSPRSFSHLLTDFEFEAPAARLGQGLGQGLAGLSNAAGSALANFRQGAPVGPTALTAEEEERQRLAAQAAVPVPPGVGSVPQTGLGNQFGTSALGDVGPIPGRQAQDPSFAMFGNEGSVGAETFSKLPEQELDQEAFGQAVAASSPSAPDTRTGAELLYPQFADTAPGWLQRGEDVGRGAPGYVRPGTANDQALADAFAGTGADPALQGGRQSFAQRSVAEGLPRPDRISGTGGALDDGSVTPQEWDRMVASQEFNRGARADAGGHQAFSRDAAVDQAHATNLAEQQAFERAANPHLALPGEAGSITSHGDAFRASQLSSGQGFNPVSAGSRAREGGSFEYLGSTDGVGGTRRPLDPSRPDISGGLAQSRSVTANNAALDQATARFRAGRARDDVIEAGLEAPEIGSAADIFGGGPVTTLGSDDEGDLGPLQLAPPSNDPEINKRRAKSISDYNKSLKASMAALDRAAQAQLSGNTQLYNQQIDIAARSHPGPIGRSTDPGATTAGEGEAISRRRSAARRDRLGLRRLPGQVDIPVDQVALEEGQERRANILARASGISQEQRARTAILGGGGDDSEAARWQRDFAASGSREHANNMAVVRAEHAGRAANTTAEHREQRNVAALSAIIQDPNSTPSEKRNALAELRGGAAPPANAPAQGQANAPATGPTAEDLDFIQERAGTAEEFYSQARAAGATPAHAAQQTEQRYGREDFLSRSRRGIFGAAPSAVQPFMATPPMAQAELLELQHQAAAGDQDAIARLAQYRQQRDSEGMRGFLGAPARAAAAPFMPFAPLLAPLPGN